MPSNNFIKNKVILFHLEAAEPSLIEKWCEEGKLPTINKIKNGGSYRRLSPPGYIDSGCVWPTFSTGTNPGKHGMGFYPRQLENGTYHIKKKYAEDLVGDHFWDLLSQAGHKMLVLDMPLTYPKNDFNGSIVCNWGDEHASHPSSSFPEHLIDDILEKFGQNELNDWYQNSLLSKEEWKKLNDTILDAIKLRTEVIKYLISNREWEGAVLNLGEIHWAGHMAWHLHDVSHPEHDPEVAKYCGNIILQTYQELDKSLSKVLDIVPNDTSVILVSSLGMGAQVGGEMLLNEILQKLKLAPTPKQKKDSTFSKVKNKVMPGNLGMSYAVQQTEKIFSPKLMMKAKSIVPTKFWDKWTRRFLDLGNNRAESKAFQVPGDHSGLIRINLIGREPKGLVSDGKEYDELCEYIKNALLELKDPRDGSPIVKEVIKIRDKISGENINEMPDIAVVWREGVPITEVFSERIGKIKSKEFHKRSGGHINSGFLIVNGPAFESNKELPMKDLLDVAPTILSLFDLETPPIMDGKIMDDIFK